MELIDFALPVGWIALGALAFWAAQQLLRDRGSERIIGAMERQRDDFDERLQRATDRLEQRLAAAMTERDRTSADALESQLARLLPAEPLPVEDDAATRLHARRRRIAPEVFAAVRDLHRATGDLVDELHGWPADVDPPDLWDAVDTARSRLHAVFARTRIHLPTPVDTLVAEYRRVVSECLKSQRAGEQLADTRPQAARFSTDRARELLRAADEHFRRIEDDLRGLVEDAPPSVGRAPESPDRGETDGAEPPADSGDRGDRSSGATRGIRPSSGPTITFESDLLADDPDARTRPHDAPASDDDDEEDDGGGEPRASRRGGPGPANGGPHDTMRPLD